MTLQYAIQFSNKANAACVANNPNELYSSSELIVSGWGNLAASGHTDEYPTWLQVCTLTLFQLKYMTGFLFQPIKMILFSLPEWMELAIKSVVRQYIPNHIAKSIQMPSQTKCFVQE